MTFASKVEYLRKKKGLTQDELAKLTNVSQVAIHAYEKGKAVPFKNTQIQLAKVLGVKVSDLMNDERTVLYDE